MLNMGLIRGASRDNCVVLTRDGIDNPAAALPRRVRPPQGLDLIGDLALFGKRILGYVKADRAGHALHTAIVSRILRDQSYAEEITLDAKPRLPTGRKNILPSPISPLRPALTSALRLSLLTMQASSRGEPAHSSARMAEADQGLPDFCR